MNSLTANLSASLTPQTIPDFNGLDANEIMSKLLNFGYSTMKINGSLIDPFVRELFLFVEEDIKFLISAYLYLQKLVETGKPYEHWTFLNDGRFAWTAISDREKVDIEFRYCPDLNAANLVTYNVTISEDEYICW